MFQLDLKSRDSIYEQICNQIKELIVTGVLKEDEKLPSVRELSKILTVNPNTVQKSYRELERQGYVYTATGLGCFVAPAANLRRDDATLRQIEEMLRSCLRQLIYAGLTRDEIASMLSQCMRDELEKGSEVQ